MTTLTDTRRALDALRSRHGAKSPIGSRCSILMEQVENLHRSTDQDHRAALARFIEKSKADLARLLNGPAPYAEDRG